MPEVLRFDDLDQYLLLKNGNYLYKVPFRDGWAVLKVYYGDRSFFEYVKKSIGNILVCNQTSFMPRGRRRTELECLELWREAGFRVFDTYGGVVVEPLPPGGYALYEYVDRPRFVTYFADESVPLEDRLETWRRFLPVWHRRHALAIERREPRFIHENGDLKHVMIMEDGQFLFFDFEMCFRSQKRVREFVVRLPQSQPAAPRGALAGPEAQGGIAQALLQVQRGPQDPRAAEKTLRGGMAATTDIDLQGAEVLAFSRRGGGEHRVLKIEHRGEPAVLKVFGLKRSRLGTVLRQFGSRVILGKSSITARGRQATERGTLELWRREGFDVPALLDLTVPEAGMRPYLAMEFVPGPTLARALAGREVDLERKRELITTFAGVWSRRHDRALELREPRLIFEHPTFDHVIVSSDRLVHFDFEIVITRRWGLEDLVGREIAGFLRSLFKSAGANFPHLLDVLVNAYAGRRRLEGVRDDILQYGTVPVMPWMRHAPLRRQVARIHRGNKAGVRRAIGEALDRALQRG